MPFKEHFCNITYRFYCLCALFICFVPCLNILGLFVEVCSQIFEPALYSYYLLAFPFPLHFNQTYWANSMFFTVWSHFSLKIHVVRIHVLCLNATMDIYCLAYHCIILNDTQLQSSLQLNCFEILVAL